MAPAIFSLSMIKRRQSLGPGRWQCTNLTPELMLLLMLMQLSTDAADAAHHEDDDEDDDAVHEG